MSEQFHSEFDIQENMALATYDIERGELAAALLRIKQVLRHHDAPLGAKSMAARLYAQLGLFAQAQKYFQLLAQEGRLSKLDLFQWGMTYFEQNQWQQALQHWDQVLSMHMHYPPALYYKSLALLELKQHQEALSYLERLVQTTRNDNLYHERATNLLTQVRGATAALSSEPSVKTATEH